MPQIVTVNRTTTTKLQTTISITELYPTKLFLQKFYLTEISQTEISSTELRIEDKLITVASGSANSSAANGGGIEVDRGSDANASITWNHSGTRFDINNGIHVTIFTKFNLSDDISIKKNII